MMSHTMVDTQDAMNVLMPARMAMSSKPPAEPQLNPNQPIQSRKHPINISGTLWVLPLDILLLLLPMAIAAATPEIPEHMWTTVPPAKSMLGSPISASECMRPPPQTM